MALSTIYQPLTGPSRSGYPLFSLTSDSASEPFTPSLGRGDEMDSTR